MILVSITGSRQKDWESKLREIEKLGIRKVALFLSMFSKKQRGLIYKVLLNSCVKNVPLVHIRNDMVGSELLFLKKNFNSKYFTIHEDSFKYFKNWPGFQKSLFLEMNTDNFVSSMVQVNKIGGFCVDLSHFKVEETEWTKEFDYIFKRKAIKRYFACNHLNGYDLKNNSDMHTIKSLKDFDYLKDLPKFLFGKVIALEVDNSIVEQMKFKNYLLTKFPRSRKF